MEREDKLSLRAYKHEVQESCLQIVKYQEAKEDKDAILVENRAKILSLGGDILDKFEKLKKAENYTEENAKAIASSLRDQITTL